MERNELVFPECSARANCWEEGIRCVVSVLDWRGFMYEVNEGNQSCVLESGGLDFAARASSDPGVLGADATISADD